MGWPWDTHAAPTTWVEVHDRRIGLAHAVASLGLVEPCTVWDLLTLLRAFGWLHEHVGLLQAVELLSEVDMGGVVEHPQPIETALLVLRTLAADLRSVEAKRI